MKYDDKLLNPKYFQEPLKLKGFSKKSLNNFLEKMTMIRLIENKIALEKKNNVIIGPVHLGVGQEAPPVGVTDGLKQGDKVFGAHRSHGHLLALNPDAKKLFSEILGKKTGFCKGNGGSMHLWDGKFGFYGSVPIVAGTVPLAVGAAFASKIKKNNTVSIAYLGDGAMEEGVVHESLNLAKIQKLPVIFVIENNLFASHMDISLRQTNYFTSRFAAANEIQNCVVDGNDVLSIAKECQKLIHNARNNYEPGFIEMITYRWFGHVDWREDIDVGLKRSKIDLENWKKRDPILRLKKAMIDNEIISDKDYDNLTEKITNEIDKSWDFAVKAPYPSKNDLMKNIYSS